MRTYPISIYFCNGFQANNNRMPSTKSLRVNYYTGETSNQLRDGFGVYVYQNKFFRYEGDWVKGKKHGHGKLIMADGSYYEGEFKNGEIEGHGYRKWQHTGHSYSGEFHVGEMHGHGVLNYADGSQYKGQFQNNCRHGGGVYVDKDGNKYEGTWHNNRQNGEGTLVFQNGDIFEGTFVRGLRQGNGLLQFANGGYYMGQWHADKFSGEGKMVYSNGIEYTGLWLNGSQGLSAKEIALRDNLKKIECTENETFEVKLHLLDQNGNVLVEESGRKFEISAGLKYIPQNKSHQSLLELIENIEEKPIITPFGYEVLPYPIAVLDDVLESELLTSTKSADSTNDNVITTIEVNSDSVCNESKQSQDVNHDIDHGKDILTDSSTLDESKSWLHKPLLTRHASDGLIHFKNLFLPYIEPKQPDDLKSKKSRDASAVSSISSDGKIEAKQRAVMGRGASPGEYVLIIKDITDPHAYQLETFFVVLTISAPKLPKKSKSKM